MSIQRKLEEWQAADLISAETAARIRLYEAQQHRQRPYLLYALGGIGALAVATGFLAIIASNWDAIPAGVKLGADLLLVAGLSAGAVRGDARGSAWARETLILLQYGVVLASMGLVAQVYHLGGAPWQALLAWTALTAPLMAQGRSAVLAVLWVAGLQASCAVTLEAFGDRPGVHAELAGSLAYLAPLACIAAAGSAWIARARPALARVLGAVGWAELAACGSLGPLAFYGEVEGYEAERALAGAAAAAVLTAVLVARAGPRGAREQPARRAVQAVLVAALLASFVPFLAPHEEAPALAALFFIGFWATAGWAGYALRRLMILNLATAMIGIRILIAYFEVFGSLLSTGLGLISGGLLTLLFAWVWVRKTRQIKQRFQAEGRPETPSGEVGGGA